MGEIHLHIDPAKLTADALNAIKRFGPGKHAGEVKFQQGGSKILCGRATVYKILEILKKHGAQVQSVDEYGKHGVKKQFAPHLNKSEVSNPASTIASRYREIFNVRTAKPVGVDRKINDRRENEYTASILELDETRGLSLDSALREVTEWVNAHKAPADPQLRPFHLVEFEKIRGSDGIDRTKPSLGRLDKVDSGLAKATWDYVHAYEGKMDVKLVEQNLHAEILSAVDKPERLSQLKSLATVNMKSGGDS